MRDQAQPSNRTIVRILVVISLYLASLWFAWTLRKELVWLGAAAFLALALNPLVNLMTRYMPGKRRSLAVTVVFVGLFALFVLFAFIFIPPLVTQTQDLIKRLPEFSNTIQHSNEFWARKARDYDIVPLVRNNQARITEALRSVSGSAVDVIRAVFASIVATVTVLVFTIFMLIEAPTWNNRIQKLDKAGRIASRRALLQKMSNTVGGYVNGNLLTSLIAAIATAIMLTILGVPFAVPLGLLVGLCDLLPLVGATLGATFVLVAALFHSPADALIMLIFYVVYQQIENHVLQPFVYSRTIKLSPFLVLISALAGAKIGGLLGALVAIPIAANIEILLREWLSTRNA